MVSKNSRSTHDYDIPNHLSNVTSTNQTEVQA